MSLTTGQSLSFHEVLGPLGTGGMGEVYLARDTRLDGLAGVGYQMSRVAGPTSLLLFET